MGVATHRDIMWKFVIVNTVNKTGNVRVNVTIGCVCITIVFVASIMYSKCVSVAFVVQHACACAVFVICDLSGSIIFCYIISEKARNSE